MLLFSSRNGLVLLYGPLWGLSPLRSINFLSGFQYINGLERKCCKKNYVNIQITNFFPMASAIFFHNPNCTVAKFDECGINYQSIAVGNN